VTVVLVTVAGPAGRRDLVVPADVPVGDLLGPVAAAAVDGQPDTAGPDRWRLAFPGGDPLPPERSLAASGVGDGAILTLAPAPATAGSPHGAAPPPAGLGAAPPWASRGAPAPPAGLAAAAPPASPGAPTSSSRRGGAAGWWWRRPRARDREDELLEAAIAAPRLGRCAVVGVVSAVAGVGGATVAALLAAVLAATRPGLTVAVDARPGPGSLSDRLPPDLDVPAGDLLGLLDHPALTTGELLACLAARPSRGSGSRSASPALLVGGRALPALVQGLARHAGVLVLDCGAGLGGPRARAAVAAADQLVLVTEAAPSLASRRVAGALVDLGHAVVVAAGPAPAGGGGAGPRTDGGSGSRSASQVALGRLLPGVRGVVVLPHPPPAVPPRGWAEVPPWWRPPARQLAYLLAADWPALGMTIRGD
jgi:WXG100 protein secretion system (Wss), protein YukD